MMEKSDTPYLDGLKLSCRSRRDLMNAGCLTKDAILAMGKQGFYRVPGVGMRTVKAVGVAIGGWKQNDTANIIRTLSTDDLLAEIWRRMRKAA